MVPKPSQEIGLHHPTEWNHQGKEIEKVYISRLKLKKVAKKEQISQSGPPFHNINQLGESWLADVSIIVMHQFSATFLGLIRTSKLTNI